MKNLLIRLISSEEHDISKEELVTIIQKTGTDRYDMTRKTIFHDHYGKFAFDFFAENNVTSSNLEKKLNTAISKFPERTKGDRGRAVIPDIAIIYDADSCTMIDGVYDYKKGK